MKSVPIKPAISYDDFEKTDVRTGIIELVEGVPKSDKPVKLTVDFGDYKRTLLTGMKQERENPKEIGCVQGLLFNKPI
ncbi:hypothetical protein FTO70_16200 [Methanosarcina sp. KYL-1]|nr:hypothetical protein [Methanosarcina sp. KYL-1]